MSGIAGIYSLNGNAVGAAFIRQMTDILAHRGSDASEIWHDGPVALGHRMLWTTPESLHEHLPYTSDDARFTVTADARIDNRDELITALGLTQPPEQITDSQLIVYAYEHWGEDCVDHLLGDFAFALWDGPRQSLFCARDHMGIKPFYYYRSEVFFAFASEIKALFCLPEVHRELNEVQIARHLVKEGHSYNALYYDPQITSFHNILRLPAAHVVVITEGGQRLYRYWAPDPTFELHFDSDEEYEQAFRKVFTEAVRCRLRSAYAVGIKLSGGLDSSSVACIARDILRRDGSLSHSRPLHCFSAVFEDPMYDERRYIEVIVAQGDLLPHYVHLDEQSPLADIEHILWHEDEPVHDQVIFYHWAVHSSAQAACTRVLLDGESGDAVVSYGFHVWADFFLRGQWVTMLKEGKRAARNYDIPLHLALKNLIFFPVVRTLTPNAVGRIWRTLHRPSRLLIAQPFVKPMLFQRSGVRELIEEDRRKDWELRTSRAFHHDNLIGGRDQYDLETLDKAAAAFSLELRHPFYDRRVVEYCLALPPEQKVRDGYTRAIVRRALATCLPLEIRQRTSKTDFAPLVSEALLRFERDRLEDTFLINSHQLERYIDRDMLKRLYIAFSCERKNATFVWNALILGLWLKRTILKRS